ncbi:MAG TPA: hypothetical protein VGN19_02940 [Pedococcus sp.]|nr:hypothetical protein [Pedococcus sp.]
MPDLPPTLAEAMQTLYAAGPEEFMAVRRELVAGARAAGDRDLATELGALRKPSVAAWAINLVARVTPGVLADLVGLGERMRDAQGRLDTATLTALRPERDQTVRLGVEAAVATAQSAGRGLGPGAREEVRATLVAALADEGASIAVASGQLTRALSYSGFGEVDLSDAVVRTASGAILTVLSGSGSGLRGGTGDGRETGRARGDPEVPDRDHLARALAEAETRLAQAEKAVHEARTRAEETRERLEVVERQLAKAREADERALEAVTDAVRARKQAAQARHAAHQALVAGQGDDA